jgi:hypothetical protein
MAYGSEEAARTAALGFVWVYAMLRNVRLCRAYGARRVNTLTQGLRPGLPLCRRHAAGPRRFVARGHSTLTR